MRNQSIDRLMTTPAWLIGPESTLDEAAGLMSRQGVHHLPVVENDRLVGVISASDLIGRASGDSPGRGRSRIGDLMQRDPVALGRNATLQDAAVLLAGGSYHSLPVTDPAGKVLGVVTSTDLLAVLLGQLPATGADEQRVPPGGASEFAVPGASGAVVNLRRATDVYLRSGQGAQEHATLVRALERALDQLGPGPPGGQR